MPEEVTIYHNPGCSKSRQTLELIREKGIEPEIVEYLRTPPDEERLDEILQLLGMEPAELIRSKEDEFEQLGLEAKLCDRSALIKAMVETPILIERPIVVSGNGAQAYARVGRPPENVLEIL